MNKKRPLLILLSLLLILSIGLESAYAFITGRNYGFKVGDAVTWNNSKYYVKPHWDIYFDSFSNQKGTAMNFTNAYDSSKGYLVVGDDQWDDWIAAFGANYSEVVSKIDYTVVNTPVGSYKFAWLSQIANASGWRVKDWDRTGEWAIYERIPVTPPPDDPPPPPPSEPEPIITFGAKANYESGSNINVPNPFGVTVDVSNDVSTIAENVTLKVNLPQGFSLKKGQSEVRNLGNIGRRTKYESFDIVAPPSHETSLNKTITFSVTYERNGQTKSVPDQRLTVNVLPARLSLPELFDSGIPEFNVS